MKFLGGYIDKNGKNVNQEFALRRNVPLKGPLNLPFSAISDII